MTNGEIVMANRMILIANGILNENDVIHTYDHWAKTYGLYVKRGEHAIAKFAIWKYRPGKKKDENMTDEEAESKGYCFMRTAAWFSNKQVVTREEYIRLFGIDPAVRRKKK